MNIAVQIKIDTPSDLKVNVRLPEIASAMQAGVDATNWGSRTGSQSSWQRPRGGLRRELGKLSNYRAQTYNDGTVIVDGYVPLEYARIQQTGGVIPIRSVVAPLTRAMRFKYHGKWMYAKHVRPSVITGKHYIERGASVIASRLKSIVSLVWDYAPSTASAGIRDMSSYQAGSVRFEDA